MSKSWKDRARAVISKIEKAHPELSGSELRKEANKHYQRYAMRKMGYAYKAWLQVLTERCGKTAPSQRPLTDRQKRIWAACAKYRSVPVAAAELGIHVGEVWKVANQCASKGKNLSEIQEAAEQGSLL